MPKTRDDSNKPEEVTMSQKLQNILGLSGRTIVPSASRLASQPVSVYGETSSVADERYETRAFRNMAYHELLENPHVEIDGLQRLDENLALLSDLHGRLHFMLAEITPLIKRR